MAKSKRSKKDHASDGGDFRYETGAARVPWHAVGEFFDYRDALEVVKFLMPPARGKKSDYNKAVSQLRKGLQEVAKLSGPATKLSLGNKVKEVETTAQEFFGSKHACFLTNWTAGMEIGYKLAGLQPGDEVIVPAITFAATMAYPLTIGAKVVFCDIDPDSINMCPKDLEKKITKKTKVVVPVHIGGYPCDMNKIMALSKKHGFYVMEDAAHGFGATYRGKYLGTIGHFGGFSLHEVKNINSFGEGGILLTDLDLGEQFPMARFLGLDFSRQIENWLYDVSPLRDRFGKPQVAGNHSSTEIQALGFLQQFKRLKTILTKRKEAALYLNQAFAKERGILLPPRDTKTTISSDHLYLLKINPDTVGGDIQQLKQKLKEKGVTEVAHFGPMYKFNLVDALGYDREAIARSCPVTEEMFNRRYTHLPLYPLAKKQVKYLAEAVLASVSELRAEAKAKKTEV